MCIAYLIDRFIRDCNGENDTKKEERWKKDDCLISMKNSLGVELLDSFHERVKQARPSMAVNPGFIKQLEIFRQMKTTCMQQKINFVEFKGTILSKPHAAFRCYRAAGEYYDCGRISKFFPLLLDFNGKTYVCKKCTQYLFTEANIIDDWSAHTLRALPKSDYWIDTAGGKEYARMDKFQTQYKNDAFENYLKEGGKNVFKVEPIQWMSQNMVDSSRNFTNSNGTLICPKCKQKVGYWDWCRYHAEPSTSIILLKSSIDWRLT